MNREQVRTLMAALVAVGVGLLYSEWQAHTVTRYLSRFGDVLRQELGVGDTSDKGRDIGSSNMVEFSPDDPNSYSRPDLCRVDNLHMALTVDFQKRILVGHVVLDVSKKKDDVKHLVLDSKDLIIHDVTNAKTGQRLTYKQYPKVAIFGSKLEIQLPVGGGPNYSIKINYETTPKCSALQWLNTRQTAGKSHPFMFSQCQAIHARSMLPCQDTPGVKSTYTAEIKAPSRLTVLMGALKKETKNDPDTKAWKIHHFEQPVCIPSYLIAIAVGALESRQIGPRSKVWAEKEFIDRAEYEFGETEKMLKIGEEVMGPYIWGQYDLLVMPPSFPFGGMENPCLTFVTPTLLAGDRSLTFVVAHEISHSWTGNLVTNKNFEHFWLNEGFTVFAERKIIGRMFGEKCRHFHAIIGWKELEDAISDQGSTNPLTHLVPNLTDVDPDDAFSTVPYEKGHSLLFYLEGLLGGNEKFEPFFRAYIEKFKYTSIETKDWKEYLYEYFKDKEGQKALEAVDWNAWFHSPGMPPVNISYDTTMAASCKSLCIKWLESDLFDLSDFSIADIKEMSSLQKCEFLSQLLKATPLTTAKVEKMNTIYDFNSVQNAEVKFRWIRLCLKARWPEIVPIAINFVTTQGRMKFVRPIFRDLYAWSEMRERAIATFQKIRTDMMYVTSAMVAKDLHIPKESLTGEDDDYFRF